MDSDITTFSELVDKLMTVNIKLYNVLEKSGQISNQSLKSQQDMIKLGELNEQNIVLIQMRSKLKVAIDNKLSEAIKSGNVDILVEAKNYCG